MEKMMRCPIRSCREKSCSHYSEHEENSGCREYPLICPGCLEVIYDEKKDS